MGFKQFATGRWGVGIACGVIGIGAGAATAPTTELQEARAALAGANTEIAGLEGAVADGRAAVEDAQARADSSSSDLATARRRIKKLTLEGEVPDFSGETRADAEAVAEDYEWKVRTTSQSSDRSVGSIISQSPAPGTTLERNGTLSLVVARKPPKQWRTVATLTGDSSTKTDEFRVPRGAKARLSYSMPQDGNNAIVLYRAPSEYVDLLLNEIGPQTGTTRLYEPGRYYLDVSGAYSISVQVFG